MKEPTMLECPCCHSLPMVLVTPTWAFANGEQKRGCVRVDEDMKPIDKYGRCVECAEQGRVSEFIAGGIEARAEIVAKLRERAKKCSGALHGSEYEQAAIEGIAGWIEEGCP